ncbi:caspase-1-like [Gadus macrocephalus]|uniref:caspase-1-like n=1 Tax=Gadus macrocephalus TaxID=80720 RepID=UPI0028CBA2F6|nr:caspase-1-like [Gadus macrocephalus]
MKIDKPPTCRLEEKYHNLKSEPEGKIEPSNLEFTTEVVQLKGFFVVRFDEGPPFELFIRAEDSDEALWSTTIREEDWNGKKKPNPWKRIKLIFRRMAARMARAWTQQGKNNDNHLLQLSERKLQKIRSEFVKRASISVIKGLLDDLLQENVISTEEKDTVMQEQKNRADQARGLIDMVMGKGERASEEMVNSMKERDPGLCLTLGMIADPVRICHYESNFKETVTASIVLTRHYIYLADKVIVAVLFRIGPPSCSSTCELCCSPQVPPVSRRAFHQPC